MWEAIQANKRRSTVLVLLLGGILLALGGVIAETFAPGSSLVGAAGAFAVFLVLLLGAAAGGESILLASAGAREVSAEDAPQLHNVVEEMRIASGLEGMPRVCIVDSPVPNAFAVGLNPKRSAVAVTTGLLARLDRYELQGVVGHEIGHIRNRDTMFLTLAGVTLGAIVMISDFYLRHIRYTAPRSRRSTDRDQSGAAVLLVIALAFALLSPLLAQLLYFACSRQREYLADASSAVYTRYPDGLAGALEKIALNQDPSGLPTNRTLSPMYIVNPRAVGSSASLFSTHPPARDRIRILVGMAGDFALRAYDHAYRQAHDGRGIIGARSLREEAAGAGTGRRTGIPLVEAISSGAEAQGVTIQAQPAHPVRKDWREAKEILHRLHRFSVLPCACGTTLKLPADFDADTVACPRCGTMHPVPPSPPPPSPSTPPPLP